MIAAWLLALTAPAQGAPPASLPADEIVVVGQRLKNLRIVTKRDRTSGQTRCFLKPSSGDAALDAGVCSTYLMCNAKVETAHALEACMRPPLTALVNDWVARRRAAVR